MAGFKPELLVDMLKHTDGEQLIDQLELDTFILAQITQDEEELRVEEVFKA